MKDSDSYSRRGSSACTCFDDMNWMLSMAMSTESEFRHNPLLDPSSLIIRQDTDEDQEGNIMETSEEARRELEEEEYAQYSVPLPGGPS